MTSFSDRLQTVIEYKNITITEFERLVGVSKGVFAKAIKNDTNITSNALQKIASYAPEINLNWLLTGNGNMLIKNYEQFLYEENDNVSIASAPKGNYGKAGMDEFEMTQIIEDFNNVPGFIEKERILLNIMNNMSEAMRRNAIANENNSISMKNIMDAYSGEKKEAVI